MRRLQAGLNAFPGLPMPLQAAHQHGFKLQTAFAEIRAQTLALLVPQRRQIVVIVGAKRGLAVAHQIKSSHDGHSMNGERPFGG